MPLHDTGFRVDRQVDVKVPMRDDVLLSADLYLPRAAGPVPAVLIRTPAGNGTEANIEKGNARGG